MTSIITTGILMVLLIGYMFINFQSSSFLEGATKGGVNSANAMIGKIAPLSWLTHFVLDGSVLPVLLSLLMLIVPFCLAVWLFAAVFGKPKNGYQSQSRVLVFASRTPRMALLDKEVRRYLACSIYVFNTAFGPVILLILAVAIAVVGPDKIISGLGFTEGMTLSNDLIYVILAGILCLFPSMTSTTASSVSLEGKQLWILKAHPVRTQDIFWSKYMLNILLMTPALIVSVIIIGIRLQMPILDVLGFIVLVSILSVLISIVGLIINLSFPRFDWDSETSVVKQSMSVVLSMLVGFVLACIPFILFFTMLQKFGFGGFCVLCIVVYGILSAASYLYLQTKGKKLFEAL
jgi:ABC-2 type transport system permease protein